MIENSEISLQKCQYSEFYNFEEKSVGSDKLGHFGRQQKDTNSS